MSPARTGSAVLSGLLGMGTGLLVAQLGIARLPWAVGLGGVGGALAALAILGVHATVNRNANGDAGPKNSPPNGFL